MRYPGLAALAALFAAQAAQALPQSATVVRDGDGEMTCAQMADEAAELSAGMGQDGPGLLGRVTGVARAGAAMLAPVAGLAIAGADALTTSRSERREVQADAKRDRWNYLNGLYAGKACGTGNGGGGQAVADASPDPTAVAVAAPTTSTPTAPTPVRPSPRITPQALAGPEG